jgi:hypothetical protein
MPAPPDLFGFHAFSDTLDSRWTVLPLTMSAV